MSRLAFALIVSLLPGAAIGADRHVQKQDRTLVIVMTNDANSNQIKVFDGNDGGLVQTLSTNGKGGVGNNAHGVRQFGGELLAVVNNGSNSVAMFRRDRDRLKFDGLVYTSSAPVSVDFSNDHMYVAGTNTVDSFVMRHGHVGDLDGTTGLVFADGSIPVVGSLGQIGVIDEHHLIATLKNDPAPGTVDVIALEHGAIQSQPATAVSAPDGTLAPFGFAVYPDGTTLITLAHSNENGLFRDGQFAAVAAAGQTAPCWMVRVDKYVFAANTASRTLSRLVGTGANVFVDSQVAAQISTGNPLDLDAADGLLAVIDHGNGSSHVSFFSYDEFGTLTVSRAPVDVGVADANGVAVLSAPDRDDD